jgi:hypothetical protein
MDLEDNKPKRAKRPGSSKKVALGASGVVGLVGIGSTLAAQITLNGGGTSEFGQGLTHTVACSTNGFTITPKTVFSNKTNDFALTALHISGIDMTPVGTGRDTSPEAFTTDDAGLAASQAKHPGQYYNGTAWVPTCDNVVLDFQLYTNDPQFLPYTYGAYATGHGQGAGVTTGLNSPLMWNTDRELIGTAPDQYLSNASNTDVAIVWNNHASNGWTPGNYAVAPTWNSYDWTQNYTNEQHMDSDHASFDIVINGGNTNNNRFDWNVPSRAISAITVESMKSFPSTYKAYFPCNDYYGTGGTDTNWPGCSVS